MDSQPFPFPQPDKADLDQPPRPPDLEDAEEQNSSAGSPDLSGPDLFAPDLSDPNLSGPAPSNLPQPTESRTREYLANERTYLSWMRTAIAIMGIGVILGRLHAFHGALIPSPERIWQIGIIFAIVGIITVFLATQHYLAVRREIADDSTVEAGRWVIVFSLAALLLGGGIVYYVLVYSPYS